jgi:hypothetical protein
MPGFTEKLVVDAELGAADGATVPYTVEVRPKAM